MLHGDIGSQGTTPYHPGNASVNANTQWEPLLRVVGPLFVLFCQTVSPRASDDTLLNLLIWGPRIDP